VVKNRHYCFAPEAPRNLRPLREYFSLQGRFRHLKDNEIDAIQEKVQAEYKKLTAKASL